METACAVCFKFAVPFQYKKTLCYDHLLEWYRLSFSVRLDPHTDSIYEEWVVSHPDRLEIIKRDIKAFYKVVVW